MPSSIADRFRQMPSERLMQIAIHEADGLTPEAQDALDAELEARGADARVRNAVQAQRDALTDPDRDLLAAAIQRLPCPECGRAEAPINAGIVADAASFVLFTTDNREVVIACADCRGTRAKRAIWKTALFGWWGFPWGPIQSVRALRHDIRTLRQRGASAPTVALMQWIHDHPGPATLLASGAIAQQRPTVSTGAGWIRHTDS